MSVEYTPPPPDFLEPPESPFRGRSRTLPARDAENGAADGGKREGTERQDEAEREGEDWDVEAEMGIDAGPSADRTEQKGRVSMYVKLFDGTSTLAYCSDGRNDHDGARVGGIPLHEARGVGSAIHSLSSL